MFWSSVKCGEGCVHFSHSPHPSAWFKEEHPYVLPTLMFLAFPYSPTFMFLAYVVIKIPWTSSSCIIFTLIHHLSPPMFNTASTQSSVHQEIFGVKYKLCIWSFLWKTSQSWLVHSFFLSFLLGCRCKDKPNFLLWLGAAWMVSNYQNTNTWDIFKSQNRRNQVWKSEKDMFTVGIDPTSIMII